MTREEAREYIIKHCNLNWDTSTRWNNAMECAVKALEQPDIIHCRDCKHYYFADNRIPQERRYVCDIGGEVWQPDDYCSYAERREVEE